MARSIKKGPFVDSNLLKKISQLKAGDKTPIKTYSRDSMITPEMIGFVFAVHNGKDFIRVEIKEEMVGHRLGEFSLTRKFNGHSKKGKVARSQGKA